MEKNNDSLNEDSVIGNNNLNILSPGIFKEESKVQIKNLQWFMNTKEKQ